MKTNILIIVMLQGLVSFTYAQEDAGESSKKNKMQTLFAFDSKITGYGSFDTKFTRMNGADAVLIGGHGGVIFNSYFYFGLGAYGQVTNSQFTGSLPEETLNMHMGYTGMMMGFNIMPTKVVHFSVPLFVGVGNIELDRDNIFVENSAFLLFEPGLQVEINVLQFMKIGLGGGYRLVNGTNLRNDISDDDLTYWTGNFSLIFGKFN